VLTEILRGLNDHGKAGLFLELLSHRARPSQILSPPRVLGATGRLLARDGIDRRALLSEIGSLGARDLRRRWLNRRRAYAAEEREPSSGATGDGLSVDAPEPPSSSLGARGRSPDRTASGASDEW
jgi:hypothetical protein